MYRASNSQKPLRGDSPVNSAFTSGKIRAIRYTQAVPFAITQYRRNTERSTNHKIDLDPFERLENSRSHRRQARDNEIQCISTTSHVKTPSDKDNIHRDRSTRSSKKKRKNTSTTI